MVEGRKNATKGKRPPVADAKAPRKQPRQERSRETIRILLDATDNVIARSGVEAVTTSAIAKEAGVSNGTLFQYYPTKIAILAAWEERIWERDAALLTTKLGTFVGKGLPLGVVIRELVLVGMEVLGRHVRYYPGRSLPELASRAASRGGERLGVAEKAAGLLASAIRHAPKRSDVVVADVDLASTVAFKATVFMALVAATQHADRLEDGTFQEEIAAMVGRYLLGDRYDRDVKDVVRTRG
ncbi:MAG: helix-turn-helix domain-containing protein [Polyangiaceae bacterium]